MNQTIITVDDFVRYTKDFYDIKKLKEYNYYKVADKFILELYFFSQPTLHIIDLKIYNNVVIYQRYL